MNFPVTITIKSDRFSTYSYHFNDAEKTHECFDFETEKEAISAADFHIICLSRNLPHDAPSDGVGVIFRP